MRCAMKGDESAHAAKRLIEHKASLNLTDSVGRSALYCAIEYDNLNFVSLLVDKSANINSPQNQGLTPLMVAAFRGHNEIVALLLQRKADTSAKTTGGTFKGKTALD